MAWGYHLLLDCYESDKNLITDPDNISKFAKTLVERIDMVPHGEPQIIHFGEGDLGGYTLIQLIETSNITAHFCDVSGDFYMDVFSCKSFDTEIVLKTIKEFFFPKRITERFVERK